MSYTTISTIAEFKNGKKRPSKKGIFPVFGGNGIMDYANSYNAENVIIIGRVGAFCGCVYIHEGKCWVSDNAILAFPREGNDLYYLYYLLKSLVLNHHHIGGAQPLMTQDIIGGLSVSIPSFEKQRSIAAILKSLDDRIALNIRINHNLAA